KIIEKNGKKIAFIGVVTPQTLTKTYLISILDNEGNLVYDFLSKNHSQEFYEKVQESINYLRNDQQVDYIILLAHLGIGVTILEENSSSSLLKNIEGADAIIDGHTHLVYSQFAQDKTGKNITIAQTGTKLAHIGVLKIHSNGTISQENIDEVPYEPILANETVNVTRSRKQVYVDKEMNEYINQIFDSFSDELNRIIGRTNFLLNAFIYASEDIIQSQINIGSENPFGNLVTDSFREYGGADFSIINAGTIRANITQGNITYRNIIDSMPFSNDILVKEIDGQTLLDSLEFGVRNIPGTYQRLPHVSGVTFKVDISTNSSVVVDDNGAFVRIEGERRVYDVKVNGEDLDLKKNYSFSSHNYIMEGGSGFSMFAPFEVTKMSIGSDNEILLNYITENLNGVVPSKYNQSEGRIVLTYGKYSNNDTNSSDTENILKEDKYVSLLGFSGLNMDELKLQFSTYFLSLEKTDFPQTFNLYLTYVLNTLIRILENKNETAICSLDNSTNLENKVKYLCEAPITTTDIDNIIINPDIKLNMNNNQNIEISPLALKYMNNLKNCPKTDQLNLPIYILENATYNIYDKQYFNITGIIDKNVSHPVIDNTDLVLMVTQLPNKTEKEINCNINHLAGNNYNLNCKLNESINCDLDGSITILDNEILFIKFSNNNTKLNFVPDSKEISVIGKRYFRNSSKKISSGAIVAIILVPIFALFGIIAMLYYFNKKNTNKHI
ncbi:MAG: 5'-nucleotidase C-terminal domain-containing protein, partial [Clostridia bacterium]|nr:5'-nucleotidase C-terminal domain-containing protein [Clostridia bacterium]